MPRYVAIMYCWQCGEHWATIRAPHDAAADHWAQRHSMQWSIIRRRPMHARLTEYEAWKDHEW